MFIAQPQIVELPETPSTSRKDEKALARRVLLELNSTWESITHFQQHYHRMFLKLTYVQKNQEQKRTKKIIFQKRKLTCHISDQLKENLTMSEGESLSNYNRKPLALSFEEATQLKRTKSHSPNKLN